MTGLTIEETRRCNLLSLHLVADYFNVAFDELKRFYDELLADARFLEEINKKIQVARLQFQYTAGIFKNESLSTVDWFAFERILIYILIRLLRPKVCVETGVCYGGNTVFFLNALHRNGEGRLISIDLRDSDTARSDGMCRHSQVGDKEMMPGNLETGFIVPNYLRDKWKFIPGDSHKVLKELKERYSFFCHDSEHSSEFVLEELNLARQGLTSDGVILVDDIDWSNGFFKFCIASHFHPLCLTDNGKDGLRVRMGLVCLQHPRNNTMETTGI